MSKKFLEEIEKNVESFRPSWRISASEVNTFSSSVLVISDHSLFPQGTHFISRMVDSIHWVLTL